MSMGAYRDTMVIATSNVIPEGVIIDAMQHTEIIVCPGCRIIESLYQLLLYYWPFMELSGNSVLKYS